jgi:ligand-binding SRPBCC domain-containing protein
MREVEVSRFVRATPAEVERTLAPARVVEYEGSFEVFDVSGDGDATVVEAGGRGLRMELRFEPREDGIYYEQEGEAGPFEQMWTHLRWTNEDEGSRVTARSGVSLRLPLSAVTDRVGAWKRRGELRRALGQLAEDLE